jgi:hypothetical protein
MCLKTIKTFRTTLFRYVFCQMHTGAIETRVRLKASVNPYEFSKSLICVQLEHLLHSMLAS